MPQILALAGRPTLYADRVGYILAHLASVAENNPSKTVVVQFDLNVGCSALSGARMGNVINFIIPNHDSESRDDVRICNQCFVFDTHLHMDALIAVANRYKNILLFDASITDMETLPNGDKFLAHSGTHGKAMRRLEMNRNEGKIGFLHIGANNPKSCMFSQDTSPDMVRQHLNEFGLNNKVALKFNSGQFIGIYSVCATTVDLLWHALQVDDVMVEAYIGKPTDEINVCFLAVGTDVRPVAFLQETNRMMENGSGGKTGMVMAKHRAINMDSARDLKLLGSLFDMSKLSKLEPILSYVAQRDLNDAGRQLFGWFDISFMKGEDGVWYATEWMCRHAVSNWCSLTRMFDRPYAEIWRHMRDTQKLPDLKFAFPCATAAEVFILQPPACAIVDAPYKGVLYTHHRVAQEIDLHFDPLFVASSDTTGGKGWLLDPEDYRSNVTRFGVFTQLGNYLEDTSSELARLLPVLCADVPNAAYRTDFEVLDIL